MNRIESVFGRTLGALALAVLLAASCDSGPTTPERGTPGIRFVSGQSATDTILAHGTVLSVEVRDSAGKLRPHEEIWFSAASAYLGPKEQANPGIHFFEQTVVTRTDAQGRASTGVQLGAKVGPAAVIVMVPFVGMEDTARYTITAGNPARVIVAPKDSAAYAGGGYTLHAKVLDRYENPRADPVAFEAGASVQVEGNRVRAADIGRGFTVARVGSVVDTAWTSVVPRGVVAAVGNDPSSGKGGVLSFELDGSRFRLLYEGDVRHLAWHPSGSRFLFTVRDYDLFVSDMTGNARPVPEASSFNYVWGTFSADGEWIYYVKGDQVYRQPVNGGAEVRLFHGGFGYFATGNPSPSPDGTKLVYARSRFIPYEPMEVLDLSTRRTVSLGVMGRSPDWSPRGDQIAYADDGFLRLIRPDGSGVRTLAGPSGTPARGAFADPDWSPDGAWVVAWSSGPSLSLVHVESGLVLPLAFTAGMHSPAWRP